MIIKVYTNKFKLLRVEVFLSNITVFLY